MNEQAAELEHDTPEFAIEMIALASVQVQSVPVPVSWQIGTETVVLVPMKTLT